MIVTPSTPTIPASEKELALAAERAENDMNRALERRDFHRAHTKYQHLKLLRTELDLRAIQAR